MPELVPLAFSQLPNLNLPPISFTASAWTWSELAFAAFASGVWIAIYRQDAQRRRS